MQFRKCGDKISIRYPTAISSKRSTRVRTCLVSELSLRFDTLEDCQILTVIDAVEKTAIESARANRVAAVARAVTRIQSDAFAPIIHHSLDILDATIHSAFVFTSR